MSSLEGESSFSNSAGDTEINVSTVAVLFPTTCDLLQERTTTDKRNHNDTENILEQQTQSSKCLRLQRVRNMF